MPTNVSFESFAEIVDNFVSSHMERRSDYLNNQVSMYGEETNIYRTIPASEASVLSSIRDANDNVMYFMVGVDRVGNPSKIGA